MGNYNPHAPLMLGQEFVPIRDEDVQFSPIVNSVERGTAMQLTAATTVGSARFYINEAPGNMATFQVAQFNLYPYGLADLTGPIQEVIIPVKSATTTGTNITLAGASTATEALYQPGDNKYIQFDYDNGGAQYVGMFFDVSSYPVLANKRILNVSFVYAGGIQDLDAAQTPTDWIMPDSGTLVTTLQQTNDAGTAQSFVGPAFTSALGILSGLNTQVGNASSTLFGAEIAYADIGDINNGWNTAAIGSGTEKLPWRYADLLRFEPSAGSTRQYLKLTIGIPQSTQGFPAGAGNDGKLMLTYAALRVTYCEERRVAYGGTQFNYTWGANAIIARDLNQGADPSIAAGGYLPTLSFVSMGDVGFGGITGDFPRLNGVRQLYELPSHPTEQINIPFPLSDHLGETFTTEPSDIVTQFSVHGSSGVTLTQPQVYGRQAAAQVYGTNTATQGIYDAISGVSAAYPQVRFYARRFGDTTVPLRLTAVNNSALSLPGTSGNYASTPDNAALDITGDIDIAADLTMADWTPAASGAILAKWTDLGSQLSYMFGVTAAGKIFLFWTTGGTGGTGVFDESTVPVPISSGRLSLRATLDVNNGAGGRTVTYYTGPSATGPWTQLGGTNGGAVTSIFSGTSNVEIGGHNSGTADLLTGATIYQIIVRNGIGGTQVANPDFTSQTPGTTSFVDTAGRTWTVNGTAAIVGSAATTATPVTIDAATFDALPEILNGWREVTLRWSTAPSLGTGVLPAAFRWSAPGETSGNRWEILAASAPAFADSAGTFFSQQSIMQQLREATYQPAFGVDANLNWMPQGVASMWVTGAGPDFATDAALIFSQDPATVTGHTLTTLTQTVSGTGAYCGGLPCCIPSGIGYNQITWPMDGATNTMYVVDSFDRVTASGIGNPDTGTGPYVLSGSSFEYATNGDEAVITPSGSGDRRAILTVGVDADISVTLGAIDPVTSGTVSAGVFARYTDANNFYSFFLTYTASTGVMQGSLSRVVGGVSSTLRATTPPVSINAGARPRIRFLVRGSTLKAKVWSTLEDEPAFWNGGEVTDTSLATGSGAGFSASTGGTGAAVGFEDLLITPPAYWFGGYELQRWDAVTGGDFQTIMLATDIATTTFNDYEARVGQTSVYRIRKINALNFAGLWSTYVSGAPPEPGVSGGACGGDMDGALIFTSNADQTGANNAAYFMQWDGTPNESFDLPEAGMVQYQPMYGRDGSVAFHGTERGLETFNRNVLLHAGAIALPSLANAETIRDLAWAQLPYVCVRDSRGNRWFSSVRVPNINVRNDAQSYMARLDVTETTRTPYPVDP